jgi:hypothetical protein
MSEALTQPADQTAGPANDDDELLTRFAKWDKLIDAHWGEWESEAEECHDFVAGHQWAKDVVEAMEEEQRVPVTFNRVAPTIDAVSGAEIMGRQQVIYEPRQVGASAQNEVLTKGADWVRDECDAEHEESEASRDCLITGIGFTETRMDYDEEPDGKIVIERVDSMEMRADPSSRKANFADARYFRRQKPYSLEEFEELWPDASPSGADGEGKKPVVVDPDQRYKNGSGDEGREDEVIVKVYQWFELQTVHRVVGPSGQEQQLTPDELDQAQQMAQEKGAQLKSVKQQTRRYRRATVAAGQILDLQDIDVGDFTWKAMTGKRDRNKGTWYGLVRPMMDPQRFANKYFAQIMNILNKNAKGGLLIEEGAINDIRQFEDSWADPGKNTYVPAGTISGDKIKDKTPPAYPMGQEKVMEYSISAVRDVTGVNQEMLGTADRDQAGVLEHQRKQAAYGILSAFFDAFRRYRKMQGRLLLQFMQKHLTPDFLVRIIGNDGSPAYQAIGTAFKDTRFTVIVDDTPAGPNEKTQVWQMIVQLMPMLQQADLGPDFWAEIIPYSPFPTALATKLQQMLQNMAQAPPSPQEQLQMADGQAEVDLKKAGATHRIAQADHLNSTAGTKAGSEDAIAKMNLAKAAKYVADTMKETQPAPPVAPEIY